MTTSDRLLAAAERILVERGVTGLSVRKVGDVAGVNPTLVTYHFKTIENLLGELATRNLDPILSDWASIVPGMTLDEVLRAWLLPMQRPACFTEGGRALVVLDEIAAHGEGAPRRQVIEAMEQFSSRLREAVQPLCPHLDAEILRARLRFISGAVLGPPPRLQGAPNLPDGRALDDPQFLLGFAHAALTGGTAS
ncbi:TetR/AcrR family transcriptional regulator [Aurantiacibacter sp. MUD11]|uniref:TetR/AcrR family transcriptional regulator n=1 Tax=Aurantiacibacter sp. MUD11 TaxID=3003265 RepID=UPI0022AB083C|nr:TetR/AcrR family transcriptional regulator [Aurantiacibacter sp. MUD11]WAT17608.1 TetR/AcrR family transcriptional regulator [Aurantiacibacter sp. MUD11]